MTKRSFINCDSPLEESFRVTKVILLSQRFTEIVESSGNIRMIGAKRSFINRNSTLEEISRASQVTLLF